MKKATPAPVTGALRAATVGLASAATAGGAAARRRTAGPTGRARGLRPSAVPDATALRSPCAVDATDAVRPGLNTIEVEVTNTLANERDRNLPSGLLGPVHLRPQAQVDVQLKEIR